MVFYTFLCISGCLRKIQLPIVTTLMTKCSCTFSFHKNAQKLQEDDYIWHACWRRVYIRKHRHSSSAKSLTKKGMRI
jgi:hypothetical protein